MNVTTTYAENWAAISILFNLTGAIASGSGVSNTNTNESAIKVLFGLSADDVVFEAQ